MTKGGFHLAFSSEKALKKTTFNKDSLDKEERPKTFFFCYKKLYELYLPLLPT